MSEAVELKKTPLYEVHRNLGASFADFAGFSMPMRYRGFGDVAEHNAVRQGVGLFDVSHMGRFGVGEQDAFEFVNHLTTNDVSRLKDRQAQYSLMCREDGGVLDDLLVYRDGNEILLVVNAGNRDKDWDWLTGHMDGFDVEVWDESDETVFWHFRVPGCLTPYQS